MENVPDKKKKDAAKRKRSDMALGMKAQQFKSW